MPAGDGTGPVGMGPMTGRGAGYCGGDDAPGWAHPVPGRGLGLGRGGAWGGRGWRRRNWYYAAGAPGRARFDYRAGRGAFVSRTYGPYAPAPSREQETEFLRQQAEWLKQQLDDIGQRIEELEQKE